MKVVLSDIRKSYGGRAILRGCSYAFDRPGVYVIMGANGCGKSTLLRIVAQLETPDGGAVSFIEGDHALPADLALRRRITLVLPRIGLFNTTVGKNMARGLSFRGERGPAAAEKIVRTLAAVGLEQKRHQHALTLSSGESQRLGIARALVLAPDVLLLDEPTASIDEENTAIIESLLAAIKREARCMVIMTTHDRTQAQRLADRLLLLREGHLEEVK